MYDVVCMWSASSSNAHLKTEDKQPTTNPQNTLPQTHKQAELNSLVTDRQFSANITEAKRVHSYTYRENMFKMLSFTTYETKNHRNLRLISFVTASLNS